MSKSLLVWADEDFTAGPLHADFKLSKDGEELALYAKDGRTLLDLVTFGPQSANVSTGRLCDHESPWVTYPKPAGPKGLNPCGARTYSDFLPSRHKVLPGGVGSPRIGIRWQVRITQAPASSAVILFVSSSGNLIYPGPLGFSLLVSPNTLFPFVGLCDLAGTLPVGLDIPSQTSLGGHHRLDWSCPGHSCGESVGNS